MLFRHVPGDDRQQDGPGDTLSSLSIRRQAVDRRRPLQNLWIASVTGLSSSRTRTKRAARLAGQIRRLDRRAFPGSLTERTELESGIRADSTRLRF
jgi:hypothetical protein